MSYRDTKRGTVPPRPRRRTTRSGVLPLSPHDLAAEEATMIGRVPIPDELEEAASSRPTRRDIEVPILPPQKRTPRGEYSVQSLRGIGADVISGSIERTEAPAPPRRRRSTAAPVEHVYLAQATKKDITVIIGEQALTLERHDALALAQIIITTFD
jgi:hypothetical protein